MSSDFDSLNDKTLLLILRAVVAASPVYAGDVLLVCQRFRSVLLSAATSVTITFNNATLLQYCRALQSMTLAGCSRLPWAVDVRAGVPCSIVGQLSHLTSLTRLDVSTSALAYGELPKLRCLPRLAHLRLRKGVCDSTLPRLAGLSALRHLDLSHSLRLTARGLSQLSSLPSLDSLNVCGLRMPAQELLAHTSRFTRLTDLMFASEDAPTESRLVTARGLTCLAHLTSLRCLDLSKACLVKSSNGGLHRSYRAAIPHLSALRCLEVLDLSCDWHLSNTDVAFLSCLTRLRSLNVRKCLQKGMNQALQHVAPLTRLSELKFNTAGLTNEGLAHLARLTALSELDLSPCLINPAAGLVGLRCMSSLRKLTLCLVKGTPLPAVVPCLRDLKHLHDLSLHKIDDVTLAHVCQLSSLTRLELRVGVLRCDGLAHLTKLRALEALDVHFCDLDLAHALVRVSELTTLRQLVLYFGEKNPSRELKEASLARLSSLHALQSLKLKGCNLRTEGGLANLSGLLCLTRLCLLSCGGISQLALPPRLRHVELSNCPANDDAALAGVGSLQALAHLSLCSLPQLTDAGLSQLRNLTTLTSLLIMNSKGVTGTGLERLTRLHSLKDLQL